MQKAQSELTLGKYMFFQQRSHMTPPPSVRIHRSSSMVLLHLRHARTFSVRRLASSLLVREPGLVCERVGSFGLMLSRSREPSWARPTGNMAGLDTDDAVGLVASSSKSVSMARSSAPVDFAVVRTVYDEFAVD